MKKPVMNFLVIVTWLALSAFAQKPNQAAIPTAEKAGCSTCTVVKQALGDLQRVKVGMTRIELEKYFVRDGGISFRLGTTYVYRRCEYIKIRVEFDLDSSKGPGLFSPTDIVKSVSEPFLQYPAKD